MYLKYFLFAISLPVLSLSQAFELVKNPVMVTACEKTIAKMKTEALVNFDYFEVPLDRQQVTDSNSIKIFYWIIWIFVKIKLQRSDLGKLVQLPPIKQMQDAPKIGE